MTVVECLESQANLLGDPCTAQPQQLQNQRASKNPNPFRAYAASEEDVTKSLSRQFQMRLMYLRACMPLDSSI